MVTRFAGLEILSETDIVYSQSKQLIVSFLEYFTI